MRNGKVFIIVGGRGTGKTTFLEQTLKGVGNVVVFQLFIDERYKGHKKFLYQDFTISKSLANKKIIIEDATQLIGSNPKNDIRKIVVSSKQIGSDVFFVFHSFNVVPPYLWQLFDYCIVFPCAAPKKTVGLSEYYGIAQKISKKKARKYKPLGVFCSN